MSTIGAAAVYARWLARAGWRWPRCFGVLVALGVQEAIELTVQGTWGVRSPLGHARTVALSRRRTAPPHLRIRVFDFDAELQPFTRGRTVSQWVARLTPLSSSSVKPLRGRLIIQIESNTVL